MMALPIAEPGAELVVPPAFGARCALCWEAFRIGDRFTSVWPKGGRMRFSVALMRGTRRS